MNVKTPVPYPTRLNCELCGCAMVWQPSVGRLRGICEDCTKKLGGGEFSAEGVKIEAKRMKRRKYR